MNTWVFVIAVLLVIFGIPAVMIACLALWERRQLRRGCLRANGFGLYKWHTR